MVSEILEESGLAVNGPSAVHLDSLLFTVLTKLKPTLSFQNASLQKAKSPAIVPIGLDFQVEDTHLVSNSG